MAKAFQRKLFIRVKMFSLREYLKVDKNIRNKHKFEQLVYMQSWALGRISFTAVMI